MGPTSESGGKYLANRAGGLTGDGLLTFNAGSLIEITVADSFSGAQASAASIAAGTIVRLNTTFTLTVTDNYLSWATLNGVTGGANGDHDNDGVKNLVEYSLANDGERGVLSGNTITFTKRGGVYGSDVTYDIDSSPDLSTWTTLGKPPVVENASTISYTFTPGTPVKNFARLKVVQVP